MISFHNKGRLLVAPSVMCRVQYVQNQHKNTQVTEPVNDIKWLRTVKAD